MDVFVLMDWHIFNAGIVNKSQPSDANNYQMEKRTTKQDRDQDTLGEFINPLGTRINGQSRNIDRPHGGAVNIDSRDDSEGMREAALKIRRPSPNEQHISTTEEIKKDDFQQVT